MSGRQGKIHKFIVMIQAIQAEHEEKTSKETDGVRSDKTPQLKLKA